MNDQSSTPTETANQRTDRLIDTPPVHVAWASVMRDVRSVGKRDRVTSGPAQFNFRGIDGVLNAVGPALRTHGVSVVPVGVDVLSTEHNPTRSGGVMKNITISVTWRVTGPAGDQFMGISLGEAADSGDKAVSKAHSVAFRTFLIQSLALPTDEPDPDQTQYERAPAPVAQPEKDWGSVIDTALSLSDEGKLRELWINEGVGTSPLWVQHRIQPHVDFVRAATAKATPPAPPASADAAQQAAEDAAYASAKADENG